MSAICRTCGCPDGKHRPSMLDKEGVGHPDHVVLTMGSEVRDIKFRLWDNHQQCWVRRTDGIYLMPNTAGIYRFKPRAGQHYIVMQYTGVNDDSGIPLYVDDIVKWRYDKSYPWYVDQVRFRDGMFLIGNEPIGLHASHDAQRIVIGNVYDNPELHRRIV